jgi:hypothetical protein
VDLIVDNRIFFSFRVDQTGYFGSLYLLDLKTGAWLFSKGYSGDNSVKGRQNGRPHLFPNRLVDFVEMPRPVFANTVVSRDESRTLEQFA